MNCDVVQGVEQQLANYHNLDHASLASRCYTTVTKDSSLGYYASVDGWSP